MFDWRLFLDRYGIDYVEAGGKVQRNNIGVACPWCDNPTRLDHLGISVQGKGYHCWKGGKAHSGRSPQRLVMALLGCSFDEADRIVGSSSTTFARRDETFAGDALRRLGMIGAEYHRVSSSSHLEFLPEFVPLHKSRLADKLAYPYLQNRTCRYTPDEIDKLSRRYGLMFAITGRFAYRIIIPVYAYGELVNWTGRSVVRDEALRYKSLTTDPDKATRDKTPLARRNIKDVLFDQDNIQEGGELLVLTEGPFDAKRVGLLGRNYGINATAFFGKEPTAAQIEVLYDVACRYDQVVALFDRGAEFDAFLSIPDYIPLKRLDLPRGVKDPGDLTFRQFREIFNLT